MAGLIAEVVRPGVGVPAKSGVGGGIVGVVPGEGAIAVFAPPLDEAANSVKAPVIQHVDDPFPKPGAEPAYAAQSKRCSGANDTTFIWAISASGARRRMRSWEAANVK